MDLTKEVIEYLKAHVQLGIANNKYSQIKSIITRYAKEYNAISETLIKEYLDKRYNPRISTYFMYKKALIEFLYFCRHGKIIDKAVAVKEKEEKKESLIEQVARRESYVDEQGILRVRSSKVPAPLAWVTALSGKVSFDEKQSRRARKKHTGNYIEDNRAILNPKRGKRCSEKKEE